MSEPMDFSDRALDGIRKLTQDNKIARGILLTLYAPVAFVMALPALLLLGFIYVLLFAISCGIAFIAFHVLVAVKNFVMFWYYGGPA